MKKFMLMLTMFVMISVGVNAQQKYQKNDQGELVQVATIHSEEEAIGTAQLSGETFRTTTGITYQVYNTEKGRKCIIKKAKSGNWYKVYLDERKE